MSNESPPTLEWPSFGDDWSRLRMTGEVWKEVSKMVIDNIKPYAPNKESYLTTTYGELNDENRIGAGSFGVVYRVKRGDKDVAVKVVSPWEIDDDANLPASVKKRSVLLEFLQTLQEAVLQSDVLHHDNVVKVHDKWIQYGTSQSDLTPEKIWKIVGWVQFGNSHLEPELLEALYTAKDLKICLCMDLYDGNLENWLKDKDAPKNDVAVVKLVQEILSGVDHVLKKAYAHGDLSLKNILYKKCGDGSVKAALTDFGCARKATKDSFKIKDGEFVHGLDPEIVNAQRDDLGPILRKLLACISSN